jgi:LmbE family N-acetylglucosaminyl deacetylase
MTRVVAILAHPDDAEILAGGTLYQHRQRGDSVEIWSVTYTPDSVRGQEGAAGAQRLGAAFTCLGLPDMGVTLYPGGCRAPHGLPPGAPTRHCADALA